MQGAQSKDTPGGIKTKDLQDRCQDLYVANDTFSLWSLIKEDNISGNDAIALHDLDAV